MCRAPVFVLPDVQCPHPWPCYEHARLEDAADNFPRGQHIEIVIAPFVGGTKGRCAFQSKVVLLHRDTVARSFCPRPTLTDCSASGRTTPIAMASTPLA